MAKHRAHRFLLRSCALATFAMCAHPFAVSADPMVSAPGFDANAPASFGASPGQTAVPPPGGEAPDNPAAKLKVTIPPAPPPGFNALEASEDELARYGLPPRPDANQHPTAFAHWSKMMAAGQIHITPVMRPTNIYHTPAHIVGSPHYGSDVPGNGPVASTPNAPSSNATVSMSNNWSGWVDYAGSGPFTGNNSFIFGEWVEPFAQQNTGKCTGGWEYSSQWVGFDGYNSGDVLQAGSEADAYCSGNSKQTQYDLWTEWYPYSESAISNFPISPGDLIGVEVWYTTASTHGGAYLIDYTTKQFTTIGFNPPSGTTYVGSSAEWIVEAPTISGGISALINYTAVPWNYAYAYSTTNQRFYEPNYSPNGTAYDLEMIDKSNNILSYCNLYGEYALWCYPYGSAK